MPHGLLIADGWVSLGLFLAGVGVLTLTLLRRQHLHQRRRRGPEGAIDRQHSSAIATHGDHAQLEQAKLELESFRRDVLAQVDTKLLVLQQLIARSEGNITRLEQLLAQISEANPGKAHEERS